MKPLDFGALEQWWRQLPAATRSQVVWPGLLATLAVLGLLLAFHQVVRGAVEQGESRRAAASAHASATWRCGALRALPQRHTCLAQLNAVPRDAARSQP